MKEFFAAILIIFLALVGFAMAACMFVMLMFLAIKIVQHFHRKQRGYRKGKESFVVIGGDYVAAEAERGQHECTTSTES